MAAAKGVEVGSATDGSAGLSVGGGILAAMWLLAQKEQAVHLQKRQWLCEGIREQGSIIGDACTVVQFELEYHEHTHVPLSPCRMSRSPLFWHRRASLSCSRGQNDGHAVFLTVAPTLLAGVAPLPRLSPQHRHQGQRCESQSRAREAR
eukprot:CAMPEP_0174700172 /NCGR_PEP_ID=MMETSP1094-20130205/5209_1 /TAXON_ID=156173 /ORGANISM="Chrysochromulina brevifilum, Strain UTEX LB 985" /LENGTH=148 /DNA_ID=CAMNT_0015897611 /DNA_START=260 /DNA_END=703 /DNA_ORIENTATION=-